MWWEILPSFAIITAVLTVPAYTGYYLNKAVLGNAYKRDMRFRWDRMLYSRDRRMVGNPYKTPGLEAIPDH